MTVGELLGLVIHQDALVEVNLTWADGRYALPVEEAIFAYSKHLILGISTPEDKESIFSVTISAKERRR